jgi:hypothetical protein
MSSVTARISAAGLLALAVTACRSTPMQVRGAFAVAGQPHVDVTMTIPPGHAADADRYLYAALTTLRILGPWLGPFPDQTLEVAAVRTPWWSTPAAMVPEFVVARAVSRQYWERTIDTRMLPSWFVGGLAEYCARRVVSKIVDEEYLAVYRSRAEGRYFGGFVPRDLRVRLRVEDEGDPVDEYRSRPRATDARALEARTLLALGTLERWVGRPAFDEILAAFARIDGQPSLDDFARLAGRVSGQNLSWFFDQTLNTASVLDYGLAALSSDATADGWFHTTVAVQRFGDGIFSGANDGSDDPFEHGRGIVVATTFADGEAVRETWDGRSQGKTFEYRSRSRAVSAEVDPDRVLLLDVDRGNNGRTLDPGPARTAAVRWAARWMIWMEDALLTYVALS